MIVQGCLKHNRQSPIIINPYLSGPHHRLHHRPHYSGPPHQYEVLKFNLQPKKSMWWLAVTPATK